MEFINIEDKIPASEWFKLIVPIMREGYRIKIYPKGGSMLPFLLGGRDAAVLSLAAEGRELKKNDIVLYRMENGIHVLHRIWRVGGDGIYTLGDAQTKLDGPYRREDIIAVVDYIIRRDKNIDSDNGKYVRLVSAWQLLRPVRPALLAGYMMLSNLYRFLFRRKAL